MLNATQVKEMFAAMDHSAQQARDHAIEVRKAAVLTLLRKAELAQYRNGPEVRHATT